MKALFYISDEDARVILEALRRMEKTSLELYQTYQRRYIECHTDFMRFSCLRFRDDAWNDYIRVVNLLRKIEKL